MHRGFRFLLGFSLCVFAMSLTACAISPTGRRQLVMNSEVEMAQMGRAAFADIKSKTPPSKNVGENQYVACVATAITSILTAEELRGLAVQGWEVEVFADPSANAFALPGGLIGVNVGLLAVARTPAQLAAVLGHEVGHVMARHGNERVSQSALAQQGVQMAQVMVGADTPMKQQAFGLLGVGMQYGVLMPFGRTQESEADEIGLKLMARAGFDPRESVTLWENMAAAAGGAAPPEFMSTHPSSATRIRRLRSKMSTAMPLYEAAQTQGRRPDCRR